MKPVVSAAQIAAQAYAQKTVAPRGTIPSGFTLDPKAIPGKGVQPVRRISEDTEAFKIEISAEALDAASRDGGRQASVAPVVPAETLDDVAEIAFQPVDSVSVSSGNSGRREAPFAHEKLATTSDDAPSLPGSVLDITI
jgi:hypothetical protein